MKLDLRTKTRFACSYNLHQITSGLDSRMFTWAAIAIASVSNETANQIWKQIWCPAMCIGPSLAAIDVAIVIVMTTAKVLPIRRPPARHNSSLRWFMESWLNQTQMECIRLRLDDYTNCSPNASQTAPHAKIAEEMYVLSTDLDNEINSYLYYIQLRDAWLHKMNHARPLLLESIYLYDCIQVVKLLRKVIKDDMLHQTETNGVYGFERLG